MLTRCPLRDYKDNPRGYSDLFKLYSFKEKGVLPEEGAYFDQPNYYLEAMQELDGAISDSNDVRDKMKVEEDKKTKQLQAMGINFTPKR